LRLRRFHDPADVAARTVTWDLLFGGLYEQQQIAFRGLTIILLAAIVLVFLLLLFLYESFRVAVAMLLIPLFAVAGVFLGLWVTRTEFNITSRMGMTMIVGIVTEIAISITRSSAICLRATTALSSPESTACARSR
jgi:multidrug efflux pump subunit AcrB